jgi:transposase
MPWRETSPMNERIRFVADFQHGLLSMTELCERYHISRKTGYKWLDRFEEEGPSGPGRALQKAPALSPQDARARRAGDSTGTAA